MNVLLTEGAETHKTARKQQVNKNFLQINYYLINYLDFNVLQSGSSWVRMKNVIYIVFFYGYKNKNIKITILFNVLGSGNVSLLLLKKT